MGETCRIDLKTSLYRSQIADVGYGPLLSIKMVMGILGLGAGQIRRNLALKPTALRMSFMLGQFQQGFPFCIGAIFRHV